MRARPLRWPLVWSLLLLPLLSAPALAQFAPGMGPGQMPQPGQEEKQGPAEQAPKQATAAAETPLATWPTSSPQETKFLQLNGYFRLRSDFYHTLDLGQEDAELGTAFPIPTGFPSPLDCWKAPVVCGDRDISTSDMRLRLEPVIHLTERVTVKSQIDVLDNTVLGSTPQGMSVNANIPRNGFTPINFFSRSQVAPQPGVNSFTDSIHAKRAWAEVHTALGDLRFGRMPSQFGLGIYANDGECIDCNFGDSADRVAFATELGGYKLQIGRDWVADGPTSDLVPQLQTQLVGGQGQAIELYNPADVRQYWIVAGQLDSPQDFQNRVTTGELVLNWGVYASYRWQYWDYSPDFQLGTVPANPNMNIFRDNAWALIPDAYFHLGWGHLDVQVEAVGIFGKVGNLSYVSSALHNNFYIAQQGAVARGQYSFLGNDLLVGMEVGYASGDEAQSPNGNPNPFRASPPLVNEPPGDQILAAFAFNPDYHVDQILFRQVLGTVTNATYVKPYIAYHLNSMLTARLDLETAFANQPVSTPGHDILYGVEPDAYLTYLDKDGFEATFVYGVLFPLGALDRPPAIFGPPPNPSNPAMSGAGGSANTAQTVRLILALHY